MTANHRLLLSQLRNPVLVASFEGWNDAGEAASSAIEYLELLWDAEQVYKIAPDDYYDFQVNRPTIRLIDGISCCTDWPTTAFSICSPPGAEHDLLLVHGVEPNFRWRRFANEVGELADMAGTVSALMLGSMMTDIPHTRPVPISGSAYSEEVARRYRLDRTQYHGQGGITAVLQDSLVGRGIPSVSLWSSVPSYISSSPNPKATLALLSRIEEILGIEIPMDQLPMRARAWEQAVNEMTSGDEEMSEYIRQLEINADAISTYTDALSEVDGDRLAADFESYLRRLNPGTGAT